MVNKMNSNVNIYHNPRCSKSRQALQILKEKNIEHTIIEYLKVRKLVSSAN